MFLVTNAKADYVPKRTLTIIVWYERPLNKIV